MTNAEVGRALSNIAVMLEMTSSCLFFFLFFLPTFLAANCGSFGALAGIRTSSASW